MAASQTVERYCNAPTRQGPTGHCRQPAGWGTPSNTGPCKNHGGALPTVRQHHAQLEALQFARGSLGQELDIDPLEGVLMAVRLSYGVVDYWRHRIADPDTESDRLHEHYSRALDQYAKICKLAVDAGVSERQIKILERLAERLSLVAEEALQAMGIDISAEARARYVAAYGRGLSRLEEQPIEGTAREIAA